MSEYTSALIIAIIGSGSLSAIVQAIIKHFQDKTKPNAIEEGMKLLIEDRLKRLMVEDIRKGETTDTKRGMVENHWQVFKALKGNGDLDNIRKDYDKLKVIYELSEEE